MKNIIQPPVLEHIPDELPIPDWSLLQSSIPLSSYARPELEKRCLLLEEGLRCAQNCIHAQEMICEGQNAQLIVQNMGMEAMNRTLHEKENPKRTDRAVLFPGGKGRHLTNPEVIQLKRQLDDERKKKEADAETRKIDRQKRKASKQRLEERWKDICITHEEAVAAWKVQCTSLKESGTALKDLPKKPKRPLKASLVAEEGGNEGSDDESESDNE
jgi:hypothetical protein